MLNPANRVKIKRPPSHYSEDFIYDCVVPFGDGRVFFEFKLDEDPEFPQIVMVSAHRQRS